MRPSLPTVRYAAVNAAYWSGFCLVLGFSSVYLLSRGLTNAQIGLVLAVSGAVSAVLQPVLAGWAGRSRVPLRGWIAGLAAATALGAAGLLIPGRSLAVDAVVFGYLLCIGQVVTPLVNAVGMECVNRGIGVDFGPARAVGSVGFALTSLGVGALVAATTTDVIPVLLIAVQGLLVAAAWTFVFTSRSAAPPDAKPNPTSPKPDPTSTAPKPDPTFTPRPDQPPLDARRRRTFALLLAGITGGYVSHAFINSYLFQVVSFHGGTASEMGVAVTIAALIETVPMLFFRRIVRRWRSGTLLRVAAVAFAVKALATWLAGSLGALYLAQCLQVAAFALVIPASVYYVDRLMPPRDRVRGQAYMTVTLTLGNVVAGLAGGALLDVAGVPALLAVGTVFATVGAVAVLAGTERV